jgi:phospholipid transport system substrate-binding protein
MRTSSPAPILAILLPVLLLASPVQAAPLQDTPEQGAREAVSATIERVLEVLATDGLTTDQRVDRIEVIVEDRFDFKLIARLVLGRNWKKLDDAQRDEFTGEFQQHLSQTYGRRLESYSGEQIAIGDSREESNGDITVKTKIVGGSGDGTAVDYRMRQREEGWFVIDVVIEGVSLLQNFRSQIQEIVSSKGTAGLIQTLREKNAAEAAPTS